MKTFLNMALLYILSAYHRLTHILRNAVFCLRYDRKLFYSRLRSFWRFRVLETLADLFWPRTRSTIKPAKLFDARPRIAVVFSFNPFNPCGMSTSTFLQCDLLKAKGYALEGLFYVMDECSRSTLRKLEDYFETFHMVRPVSSDIRRESDGVTAIDLDRWCGRELLDKVKKICTERHPHALIAHQPWLSRCLEEVPPDVTKYLFMHDNFVDRGRLFQNQGLKARYAGLSLRPKEQRRCLLRADIVFAVQDEEKAFFEEQLSGAGRVVTVGLPFADKSGQAKKSLPAAAEKIMIGVTASSNANNRHALEDFCRLWALEDPAGLELHIAGPVCEFLKPRSPSILLWGRIDDLDQFYSSLDMAVNPDFSGTGLKVKSLEAVSYGKGLICGAIAATGLNSAHPYHNLQDRPAIMRTLAELVGQNSVLNELQKTSIELFAAYQRRYDYSHLFEAHSAASML